MDLDGSQITLVIYVDEKRSALNALKIHLISPFAMKDLGPVEHIFGMRIKRDTKPLLMYPKKSTLKNCLKAST